ncbi:MAG TPA: hypothetical protein VEI97_00105, partial [bacterium]|nr:hypothetical protein [bacterium]
RTERARRHCQNFQFHITPNSSYNITDMQRQLMYLQLWRDGRFPIDPQTVAEALNVPNFGKDLEGTVIERWKQWVVMMAKAQMAMQQQAMAAQAASALGGIIPGTAGPPEGRPPSGGQPPQIRQVNDAQGPRTVVSESG